ncbi:MAG: hypothetical protein IIW25_03310 [Bacteroidales bacterium]|nr:hypothetical protein [Bacteroidales bacterium]
MSGFENINDYITVLDDIYAKKVNKTTFVLLIIAGLCALFASTKLTGPYVVGVLLFCIAFGMIIIGLVGLTKPVERYFCKATKEPVEKQILYFDAADKEVVRAAIREGNKSVLKMISDGTGNSMRAVVYATPSYSYSVSQLQTYVPHEYVPIEEPVICSTCRAN